MDLTLRQALTFGGLSDAVVVAGKDYLDRRIKSVSILEIADPMVSQWASNEELYISSLYSIPDNLTAQKNVIQALSNCGCSGLVIGHLGLWFEKLPGELVSFCEELHFPLIVANPDKNYLEIINPIYKHLMNSGTSGEYISLKTEMINIVMTERNIYEALKKITAIANVAASFFDYKRDCIYSNKNEPDKQEDSILLNENPYYAGKNVDNRTVVPIYIYDKYQGSIVIDGSFDPIALPDYIQSLKIAYSFLLFWKRHATQRRSDNLIEYLTLLINGDFHSEASAVNALKAVNIDAERLRYVVSICRDVSKEPSDERQLNTTIFMWLQERVKNIVRSSSENNVVILNGNMLLLFLDDFKSEKAFKQMCEELRQLFCSQKDLYVSIGISERAENILDFPQAYEQAVAAAKIGFLYCRECCVVSFGDVWVLQHFFEMRNSKTSSRAQKTLKKIIDADRQTGSSLLNTLKVLLECNDNIAMAAEKLYIHRNTVRFRRDKIIEILGENPFSFPQMLTYYVSILLL
ncbi:MAG: PucR family transcriptional regulator ligand-binding domain-containing protein [Oscillospiraceae bacterium]|nr:PucR family transcriptional regulator ligand-binding domain-containing protein [Oscillospiraceae bacterium]